MNILVIKILLVVAAIATVFGVVTVYNNHQRSIGAAAQYKVDQEAATKLKVDAARKLADLQIDKEAADKAFSDFKNIKDVNYVQSQKQVTALSTQLRDLGQLRDPYGKTGGCGSGSGGPKTPETQTASVSADNRTESSGLLSPELTRFLWQKDADADEINIAYSDCKATLVNLQSSPAFSQ